MTNFSKKLAKVLAKINSVKKESTNPYFNSKYADLNAVLAVCKDAVIQEELYITQICGKDMFGSFVETKVFSEDNFREAISSRVYLSGTENDMQKVGAAITYARRYGLLSLFALESEDDDGESAVGRGMSSSKDKPATKTTIKSEPKKANNNVKREIIKKSAHTLQDLKVLTLSEFKSKVLSGKKVDDLDDEEVSQIFAKLKSEFPQLQLN